VNRRNFDKKGWICGARGMLAHANKSHKVDFFGGKKLDSTNIIDFCTQRELSASDLDDINLDLEKIEKIPCREVINASQQAAASIEAEPEPKIEPNIEFVAEDEPDRPYDWLAEYPMVVMGKAGKWVELRCDICGVSPFRL
jgi:hypothetical protein